MSKFLIRKMSILLISILMISVFAGCNAPSSTGDKSEKTDEATQQVSEKNAEATQQVMDKVKIVMHKAGGLQVRKDDPLVKDAIEKKFLRDTGINIDLDVKLNANEDFVNKVNLSIAAGDQIDVLYNYIGGASDNGLAKFVAMPGLIKPLNEFVDKFGNNLKKAIPEKAWNTMTFNGSIMGIPFVEQESIFGILIRKDWLDELKLEVPKSLDDMEKVLEAFKNKGNNIIPLVGNPWDTERVVFNGAFDVPPYWWYFVDQTDGLLKPATLSPKYKEVLKIQYKWVKNGWWDKDNKTRPWDAMLNQFISGQAGVFTAWAEITFLIDMARKTKDANPNAQFEILGPLEGPEGKSAFLKQPVAFSGISILQKSKVAEYIIKFVDWELSNAENQELLLYGIKDQHWTKPMEGVRGLPADKKDEFLKEPPYSGAYALAMNINVSDLISEDYTEKEREWISKVRGFNTLPDILEGIPIPALPEFKTKLDAANTEFFSKCIDPAWAGIKDPEKTYDTYANKYYTEMKAYFEAITQIYKEQLASQKAQ